MLGWQDHDQSTEHPLGLLRVPMRLEEAALVVQEELVQFRLDRRGGTAEAVGNGCQDLPERVQ